MNEKEYKELCSTIPPGTTLSFNFDDQQVRGKFVGCTEDAVVIETNGRNYIWPRELLSCRISGYPIPSYS